MSSTVLEQHYKDFARRLEAQRERREELEKGTYKPKIIKLFDKRLSRNMDVRVVIAGEGGVGKSTLALDIGEKKNPSLYIDDPDSAVEKAVSFTGKEYMDGVRTLPSDFPPPADPLERTVLDFDEPGQAWYHRQFMSDVNMILSKTFIGFRYKRFVSVLSVPNIDFLDLDALRLVQWLIWVPSQGTAEVFRVMVQKFGGNPWYKKIIDRLKFGKPGTKLWNRYETKKFAKQDELYEKYGKKMEQLETPQLGLAEMLLLIKEDPKKYMRSGQVYVPYLQRPPPLGFGVGINKGYLLKAMYEGDQKKDLDTGTGTISDGDAASLLKKIQEGQ